MSVQRAGRRAGRWSWSLGQVVAVAACAGIGAACSEGPDEPEATETFFATDLAGGDYTRVRDCRAPGEHSALGGFTVWLDEPSADAFEALWNGMRSEMPAGAVVVKVTYFGPSCDAGEIAGYLAMKKTPGFNSDEGDWHWQELDENGSLVVDGSDSSCAGCHEGVASCTNYGRMAGLDYLCTEP